MSELLFSIDATQMNVTALQMDSCNHILSTAVIQHIDRLMGAHVTTNM